MLVPDEVRKCVVFVLYTHKISKIDVLAGTAFFVGVPISELGKDMHFVYLVTAKHVIDSIRQQSLDGIIHLRMNNKDGSTLIVNSIIDDWRFHPSTDSFVDVAALQWAPNMEIFDFKWIPTTMATTEEVVKQESIGCGDEVFVTGLFAQHSGKDRNIPIVRIGNIACMPEAPVQTKYGPMEAYLIEARSIGGISGSPVFVHLSGLRKGSLALGHEPIYWLGLVHGHFDVMGLDIDNIQTDNLYNLAINMGIAIVTPVMRILEVLNQPIFTEVRKRVIEEEKAKKLSAADTLPKVS